MSYQQENNIAREQVSFTPKKKKKKLERQKQKIIIIIIYSKQS